MSANTDALNLSLIWLDNSTHNPEEHIATEQQLRLLDTNLKTYKNEKESEDYIKSQPEDAHIVLITNGTLGQQIVPKIHDLPQIISIYIYCLNKKVHDQWVPAFAKVRGVFVDFNILREKIQIHYGIQNNTTTNETSSTDIPQTNNMHTQPTYELDSSYFISDSCFDYLVRMKTTRTEEDDFFALCQTVWQGDGQKLSLLQELQERYSSDQAVSWLVRDPFFSSIIDTVFQTANIDLMYQCRGFIRDIQNQLEQHKCTSVIQAYRGQSISNEDFEELKNSSEKIIAMKSFLWTSLDRESALVYTPDLNSSNEYKRILFTIEADPQIIGVKPFAKIDPLSNCGDPSAILFMIGSIFKITEIQDEKDGLININMILCENDDSATLKSFFDQLKKQYVDSQGETDVISFGQLIYNIGHSLGDTYLSAKGETYIRSYLDRLENDHPDRPRCYDAFGTIDLFKGNLDACLESYVKSFEIKKQKLQSNDPQLAESYLKIASVHLQRKDNSQAFENFKHLLLLYKQIYGDDHINLLICYAHMATIHQAEERLPEAISCYYQTLAIMIKYDSIDKGALAAVYNNLGNTHTDLKNYHLALGYYNTALEMKLKFHPSEHLSIAITYNNIGQVYRNMDNIEQSRQNLEKAAEIYRQLYSPDNTFVVEIEEIIRNLPTSSE